MRTVSLIFLIISSVVLPAACFTFSCMRLRRNLLFPMGGAACFALFGILPDRMIFSALGTATPAMYMLSVSDPQRFSLLVSVCSAAILVSGIYIIMKKISPGELDSFTVISFGCGFSGLQVLWRYGIDAVYMIATRQSYLYDPVILSFAAARSLSLFITGVCVCILVSENVLKTKAVYTLLAFSILSLCLYPVMLSSKSAASTSVMIVSAILGAMCVSYVLGKRRIL